MLKKKAVWQFVELFRYVREKFPPGNIHRAIFVTYFLMHLYPHAPLLLTPFLRLHFFGGDVGGGPHFVTKKIA